MLLGMDPSYLLLMLIGIPLTLLPQWWVKSTYNKYREERTASGQTGAQVAAAMLERKGLRDVSIEETPGELSDHYDPGAKAVRLSPDNYRGNSVAAATIAAHEVGHAIQHAEGYMPVIWRGQLAPVFGLGSQLGPLLVFGSGLLYFMMGVSGDMAYYIALLGVALFGLSVVFHLITLPVEFDASRRALATLSSHHYLTTNEMGAARTVLIAAAMTYVSVALYSILQLVYYLMRAQALRSRD